MQYDGLQRQLEMFLTGMMGEVPEIPAGTDALRERAQAAMTPQAYGYVAGSAGNERTAKANVRAFDAYPIVPRLLRNVESRDLSTTVLGAPWPAPVALAPIGVLGIVHEEGEKAVARAASKVGVPFVLSTVSSFDIETVAAEAGEGRRWFQLYWPKSRELALSLVKRAEAAGYSALVVTLDTYLLAWRPRDLENGYVPFVYGDGLANYVSDPVFRAGLGEDPADNPTQTVLYFASIFSNAGLTWDDLAW
ncbi:MAG: alpha-hydroxy-acid oxidizing protein, partial [Bacteroidota bacterium]